MDESLELRLDDWAEQGLVTADQARAVREYETSRIAPSSQVEVVASEAQALATPQAAEPRGRVQVMGEVLGYVGGLLAVMALFALGANFWEVFGRWGQIALAASVTLVCVGGGWALGRSVSPTTQRLASFLIFFGTWSFGLLVAILNLPRVPRLDEGELVVILVFAFGAGIWWFRRTSLQLLAPTLTLAFWVAMRSGGIESAGWATSAGIAYLVLGAMWAIAAELGWISPPTTAWALGSLGMVAGVELIAVEFESAMASGITEAFGVALGFGLIVIALWRRRGAPLGFGAAAVVLFVPQLLNTVFADSLGVPLALLVAGVLLVIMSVVVIAGQARLKAARLEVLTSAST